MENTPIRFVLNMAGAAALLIWAIRMPGIECNRSHNCAPR